MTFWQDISFDDAKDATLAAEQGPILNDLECSCKILHGLNSNFTFFTEIPDTTNQSLDESAQNNDFANWQNILCISPQTTIKILLNN